MNVLTLKDPKILGEEHPTYGYSVWSETDGDYPVMFNTKQGNIMPGTRITYESAEPKTSSKGNDYLRLKKVQLEDSPQTQAPFEKKDKPSFDKPPTFEKAKEQENTKDRQITKNMVWKNLLGVYDVPSMVPDSQQWQEFWGNVELHTEMLINGNYDILSKSGLDKAREVADSIKAKQEPEFTDKDIPEEFND